ncbi:hypothetical protein CVV65_06815 [Kyrpidia spormannii]|uniref:Uncharacterized protein n=1 Tax=Kyrpidia spormannii TaxID=2055160 RepID=A0A2K8N8C3_9BACL|nr:hypothetical protein CVV65_06815 [Kyrpidia spormannii]
MEIGDLLQGTQKLDKDPPTSYGYPGMSRVYWDTTFEKTTGRVATVPEFRAWRTGEPNVWGEMTRWSSGDLSTEPGS